jgi:CheY-like chemotaxis protein
MAQQSAIRRPTILCVDDNENGLLIRKEMLEVFGFSVELATSGQAALRLLEHTHFDAVVTDLRMPEMDGAELTQRIKGLYPATPVLLLTGYAHDIPPHTLQLVDAMVAKGDRPEKLLDALFRITGATRRRTLPEKIEMFRRNTDHVHAVKRFLREDIHRKP